MSLRREFILLNELFQISHECLAKALRGSAICYRWLNRQSKGQGQATARYIRGRYLDSVASLWALCAADLLNVGSIRHDHVPEKHMLLCLDMKLNGAFTHNSMT